MPKLDGRIRICIDFRDINKACIKDDFPLPNIDTLMDNMAGHEMCLLMDRFYGYNQIMMTKEDKYKMTFITPWGIYYYQVMSFGLKREDATYHRAMTYILHDYIYDIVEDYVDDLIMNTNILDSHMETLCKILDWFLEYNVRLNPKKCVFRVLSRNLLGFIVYKRSIEMDPHKVKVINDIPPLYNLKQLQSWKGKI